MVTRGCYTHSVFGTDAAPCDNAESVPFQPSFTWRTTMVVASVRGFATVFIIFNLSANCSDSTRFRCALTSQLCCHRRRSHHPTLRGRARRRERVHRGGRLLRAPVRLPAARHPGDLDAHLSMGPSQHGRTHPDWAGAHIAVRSHGEPTATSSTCIVNRGNLEMPKIFIGSALGLLASHGG